MPLPRWLAHINKWVFNPMEVRRSHPRCHRQPAPSARVIVGGMTLAVPGATGFVALAQRAVIGTSARITVRTFGRNSMMGR
jgi:hypothetical protein